MKTGNIASDRGIREAENVFLKDLFKLWLENAILRLRAGKLNLCKNCVQISTMESQLKSYTNSISRMTSIIRNASPSCTCAHCIAQRVIKDAS